MKDRLNKAIFKTQSYKKEYKIQQDEQFFVDFEERTLEYCLLRLTHKQWNKDWRWLDIIYYHIDLQKYKNSIKQY